MMYTERMNRILKRAQRNDAFSLFQSILKEESGVCAELASVLDGRLEGDWWQGKTNSELDILKDAQQYMNRYNQVQLQEGHVIAAILDSGELDEVLSGPLRESVIQIACSPRDLSCDLNKLKFDDDNQHSYIVRKVVLQDQDKLLLWVQSQFGEKWAAQVERAFHEQKDPAVFVAWSGNVIVGFACYDVFEGEKGWFGPMGTVKNQRGKGVGRTLLHSTLCDMRRNGYHKATIKQAGPIEFYEKACKATIIPLDEG